MALATSISWVIYKLEEEATNLICGRSESVLLRGSLVF